MDKETILIARQCSQEPDRYGALKTLYECPSCKSELKFGYLIKYCERCGHRIEFGFDGEGAIN